ncbi:hypothetical protein HK098_008251 [Nowakowskiella sp. JEL0407]|nr:hypothetical protein HK098_008251 [Nowakowskiella sp. JEL0407]
MNYYPQPSIPGVPAQTATPPAQPPQNYPQSYPPNITFPQAPQVPAQPQTNTAAQAYGQQAIQAAYAQSQLQGQQFQSAQQIQAATQQYYQQAYLQSVQAQIPQVSQQPTAAATTDQSNAAALLMFQQQQQLQQQQQFLAASYAAQYQQSYPMVPNALTPTPNRPGNIHTSQFSQQTPTLPFNQFYQPPGMPQQPATPQQLRPPLQTMTSPPYRQHDRTDNRFGNDHQRNFDSRDRNNDSRRDGDRYPKFRDRDDYRDRNNRDFDRRGDTRNGDRNGSRGNNRDYERGGRGNLGYQNGNRYGDRREYRQEYGGRGGRGGGRGGNRGGRNYDGKRSYSDRGEYNRDDSKVGVVQRRRQDTSQSKNTQKQNTNANKGEVTKDKYYKSSFFDDPWSELLAKAEGLSKKQSKSTAEANEQMPVVEEVEASEVTESKDQNTSESVLTTNVEGEMEEGEEAEDIYGDAEDNLDREDSVDIYGDVSESFEEQGGNESEGVHNSGFTLPDATD